MMPYPVKPGRYWPESSGCVWIGQHNIADHSIKVMASNDELAQSAARGTKGIKFFDLHAAFLVCFAEFGELFDQVVYDTRIDRVVDPRQRHRGRGSRSIPE